MNQQQAVQDQILERANEAIAAGNIDEATDLMKELPLPPAVANAVKQVMGINFLREAGFDLSEAEARYGTAYDDIHRNNFFEFLLLGESLIWETRSPIRQKEKERCHVTKTFP